MPKVRPLGTQPDPRPERLKEAIGAGMARNDIRTQRELASRMQMGADTLYSRMRYPNTFKMSEVWKMADTLGWSKEDALKIIFEDGRGEKK